MKTETLMIEALTEDFNKLSRAVEMLKYSLIFEAVIKYSDKLVEVIEKTRVFVKKKNLIHSEF